MNAVLLITNNDQYNKLVARIPSRFQTYRNAPESIAIEDGERHAYLVREDSGVSGIEQEQIDAIQAVIPNPFFVSLEYNSLSLCRELLVNLADDPNLLIDNDNGTVISGSQFVARLRQNPTWDWSDE